MKNKAAAVIALIAMCVNLCALAADRWSISEDGVLTFADGIEEIYETEFFRNEDITAVTVPDSVKKMGTGAFSACKNLVSVSLPEGLEVIPEACFNANEKLKKIAVPSTVKKIEHLAFGYCYALGDVSLPEGLTELDFQAFQNCEALRSIVLPDNVETLRQMVFCDCEKLEYIALPKNLKTIENRAFWQCTALKEITLPEGTEEIESEAFFRCASLKKIYIPESVKVIGEKAFGEITGLTVYGKSGSYAEEYAKANKLNFEVTENSMYTKELPKLEPVQDIQKTSIVVSQANGETEISAEGKNVIFPDAKPFVDEAQRTQIPVRALSEVLGYSVDWDADNLKVTLKTDTASVYITIGERYIQKTTAQGVGETIYGYKTETIEMDTEAKIIGDRTYIPLRFIAEALGCTVEWK